MKNWEYIFNLKKKIKDFCLQIKVHVILQILFYKQIFAA